MATKRSNEPPASLDVRRPVAWIRLNRPAAMNAIDDGLLHALNDALDRVEQDSDIRVAVLTGTAGAFCAGADLKGLPTSDGSVDPEELLAFVRRAGATIERIPALPKPVIAAVNGLAAAGGLELAIACDVVIAARSARLGDAHSNYGLLPGGGGAARLPRIVGPTVAKYLAFTGALLPAAELVPLGLVNEVVDDDRLEARAAELAEHIAARSPSGLARMKRLIDGGLEQPLAAALQAEHEALLAHAHSADVREGLAAFREKRTPRFETR